MRSPCNEWLSGRLLADDARLAARLGEDELGCRGTLHRGVAPQDKGRAHRGKGTALRFYLVWWPLVEPVESKQHTRTDAGLALATSLPRYLAEDT